MEPIKVCWLLFTSICYTSSSLLDDLKTSCPYTNFCTAPSLKTFNPSDDVIPCCFDCFCDDDCLAHGDCCPDRDLNKTRSNGLSNPLECKSAYVNNRFVRSTLDRLQWHLGEFPYYRTIDYCPENFPVNHVVHKKCLGNFDSLPDFDDEVLVSDGNFRIFKNKHCALCHGQKEFKRWKMVVTDCEDQLAQVRLTLSELQHYILNYCIITFERPAEVQLNARTLDCRTELCTSQNQNLFERCTEGPHMPYVHVIRGGMVRVYTNIMCAMCFEEKLNTETCPVIETFWGKSTLTSYKVFFYPKTRGVPTESKKKSQCSELDIYDPYKEACRPMFCPPFEVVSFGECTKMSDEISDLYVEINIVFPIGDNNITLDHPCVYNNSLSEYYLKQIVHKFGFSNCNLHEFSTIVFTAKGQHRIIAIVTALSLTIEKQCSFERLAQIVKLLEQSERSIVWLIKERLVQLKGHVTFFGTSGAWESYDHQYLMVQNFVKKNVVRVREFFSCSFVILNIEEYKLRVKKMTNVTILENLSKLSFTTRMFPGFYALTEKDVAVCVETYIPTQSGSSFISQPSFMARVINIFVFINICNLLETRFWNVRF